MRTLLALSLAISVPLVAAEHAHDAHGHEAHAHAPAPATLAPKPAAPKPVAANPAPAADAHGAPAAHAPPKGLSPLEGIARLSSGNGRFAVGKRTRSADSSDDADERETTAKGQHPFAAILTCADSRLSPDLIFDQSIGDVFVIRNAGNVAEPVGEGSLEYAIEHLGVRLIVVLGHAQCGAVKAVTGSDAKLPGRLVAIQDRMPGLRAYFQEVSGQGKTPEQAVAAAVARNAEEQALALLTDSAVLREAAARGDIAVVPAVYDLAGGLVEFRSPISVKR